MTVRERERRERERGGSEKGVERESEEHYFIILHFYTFPVWYCKYSKKVMS